MEPTIEMLLNEAELKPTGTEPGSGNGLPVVTHQGAIYISGVKLDVLQLDDGRRIIPAESVNALLRAMEVTETEETNA